MYYLAVNCVSEGWSLKKFATLEEIKKSIKTGETFGNEFKVLKEIDFEFVEDMPWQGRK